MTKIIHNSAKIGDIVLHYAQSGMENDELVLMLHGFPEFWYCWKDQLPVLGDKYHAVAPDMRGYNLSDKPEGVAAYKIRHLVADVVGLAAHFGKDRFYLVAHDWGAAIAWAVAIAHPDKVKGLIILNGVHPYIFANLLSNNDEQIAKSQYIRQFQQSGIEHDMLAHDCEWLMEWTFKEHVAAGLMSTDDEEAYKTAWKRPGALNAMLNYYRASPLLPATPETKGKGFGLNPDNFHVTMPVLVVWGEADHALVKENLDGLEEFAADLKIVRLPGVTHWVTHEAPEIVSFEIMSFLDRLELRKPAEKR